jgi:hypothetical protein
VACFDDSSVPVWAFIALGLVSHLRGTVLIVREVVGMLVTYREKRRRLNRKSRY